MCICRPGAFVADAGSDLLLNSNEIRAEFVVELNWERIQGVGCGK
jgi:hypothetical protein